jgi:hypothetical protein
VRLALPWVRKRGTKRHMRRIVLLGVLAALAACTADGAPPPRSASEPPPEHVGPAQSGTTVLDADAAAKLLAADGVTLQWIDWNHRGQVYVRNENGTIRLTGSQVQADGPGRLFLDGAVREIGADYFVFDGVVRIDETPDPGRHCEADKLWHFAVTQGRPYWRLREFEWCDGLTDYVDIYMPGTKP